MMQTQFDVLVAKEYETTQEGHLVKKTAWNRVGKAWPSKSGNVMTFELFMYPATKYIVKFQNNENKESTNE